MPRFSLWLLALALPLLSAGCQTAPPPDDLGPVGSFTLTERNEKTVTQADLLGKVWIASFVFTRCTGPCPQVSGTMARLQSDFADQSDVRLVTFTVDPDRDDPKELERYAANFRAEPQRWLFLTGKEKEIHTLLREGFKVPVERRSGQDVKPGEEIMHSPRLVVVDRKGHIRGYFMGVRESLSEQPEKEFEENLKKLHQTVAILLREAP